MKFVYDGADVVRNLDGSGNTTADYLNGPGIDNKLRHPSGGVASYFIQDHLSTTRVLPTRAETSPQVSVTNPTATSPAALHRHTTRTRDAKSILMLV